MADQSDDYVTIPLWGGDAVATLPNKFVDVSKIRQIPDNQECFIERDGFTSIIFDILQRVGPSGSGPEIDGRALTQHVEDIMGDDSEHLTVWNTSPTKISRLPDSIPAYTLIATTPSAEPDKAKDSADSYSSAPTKNLVFTALILTLIRLEKVDTDIVITINVPHIKGEYEESDVDLELGNRGKLIGKAVDHAAKIWESFNIKNLALFGEKYEGMTAKDL